MKTKAFKKPISVFLSLIMVLSMFSVLGAVSYAAIDGVPTRTNAENQNWYPDETLYEAEKWDKSTGLASLSFSWNAYSWSLGYDPQPGSFTFTYPSHIYLNVGETLEAAGYMGHMTASYGENDGSDVTDFRVMLSSATWGESTRENFSPISQLISNYGHQGTCTEGSKLMTGSSSHYDFSNDAHGSDQIIRNKTGENENFEYDHEKLIVWRSNIQWTSSDLNNFDEYVFLTGTAKKTGEVVFNPTSAQNFTIGAAQRYTASAWHTDNGARLNRWKFNNGSRPEVAPAEDALSITVTVYDKSELNRLIEAADNGVLSADPTALAAAKAVLADREVTQAQIDAAANSIGDRMTMLINANKDDYASGGDPFGTAANTFDAQAYHQGDPAPSRNVVYSPIWSTSWWGYENSNTYLEVGRQSVKLATPENVVMVYDGVSGHEPFAPIVLETMCNDDGGSAHQIYFLYKENKQIYNLGNESWSGSISPDGGTNTVAVTDAWNFWPGNYSETDHFSAQSDDSNNRSQDNLRDKNKRHYWWNTMAYVGSGNTTSYYDVESDPYFYMKMRYNDWGNKEKDGWPMAKTNYYTINYEPVYNKLDEAAAVKAIIDNPYEVWKYTEASVNRVKATLAVMVKANPKSYTYSNVSGDVETCANYISDAVYMFANRGLELDYKQGTVTFVLQDGTTVVQTNTKNYGETVTVPVATNGAYLRTDNAQWDYTDNANDLRWEPDVAAGSTITVNEPEKIYQLNDNKTVQKYEVSFYDTDKTTVLYLNRYDEDTDSYVYVPSTKEWQYGDYPDWGDEAPSKQDYDYNYAFDHWTNWDGTENYELNAILQKFEVADVENSTRADLDIPQMTKYVVVWAQTARVDAYYTAYEAALEAAEAVRDTPGIDAPTALAIQAIITTEIARAHDDQGRNYRSDDADGVADIAIAVQHLLAIVADYTDGEGNLKDEYKANYTVTFYAEDGETVLDTKADYHYGDAPEAPTAPVKATAQYTYTFLGWNDGETTYTAAELPAVTANVTYTAVYDNAHPVTNTYTVRFFDLDDHQIGEAQTVEYGASAAEATLPTKEADNENHYIVTWDTEAWQNVTGDVDVHAEATPEAHEWDYENAAYVWTGYTSCTATVPCTGCEKTKVYVSASVTDETSEPWDCMHKGTKTYTAHFEVAALSATTTEDLGYGAHSATFVAAQAGENCVTKGTIAHYHCSVCGKDFAEETCETELSEAEVNNGAYGEHVWGAWTVTIVPTLTAVGEAKRVCTLGHEENKQLTMLDPGAAEVTVYPAEETPGTLVISAVKDDENHVIATDVPVVIPAFNYTDYTLDHTAPGNCTVEGTAYYNWNGNDAYGVDVTIPVNIGTVATAHAYHDAYDKIIRPVKDETTGEWGKGTLVYYCYNTENEGEFNHSHDKTEEVDRANYTAYDALKEALEELDKQDLVPEIAALVDQALSQLGEIAQDYVVPEQDVLDALVNAVQSIKNTIDNNITEAGENAYNHYTVTFTQRDGSVTTYNDLLLNAVVNVPEAPAMVDGYVFEGWTLDGTTVALAADAATYTVTGNAAFTAKYSDTATLVAITWIIAGEPTETDVVYGETPTHALPTKADDEYYTYSYAWDPAIVPATEPATYTAVESKTWNEEKQAVIDAGEELVDEHAAEYDPEYVEDIEDLLEIVNDETKSDEEREEALDDLEVLLSEQSQAAHKYYTITWVNAGEPTETSVLFGDTPEHDLPTKADDEYYKYSYTWDPAIVAVTGEATYTAVESKTWNEEKQAIINEAEELLDEHADEYDDDYTGAIEDLLDVINDETKSDEEREEALDDLEDLLDEQTQAEHRFYTVTWINAGEPAATSVHYGDTPAHDLPVKDDDTLYTYSYAWDRAFEPVTEDTSYTAIETKTYNEHVLEVIDEAEELIDEHADEYDDGYIDAIEHDLEVLDDPDATDEEKIEALRDLEEKLSEEGKEANRLHTLTVVYGNGAENKTLKGKAGASVTIDEAYPVREGYAFTGWTADKGTVNDKTYTFAAEDATVTAGWYDLTHVNEVIDDGEDVIADDDYDDGYQQQIEDLIDEIEDLIDNPPVDPETLEDLIEQLEDLLDEETKEENKLYTLTVVVSGETVATYRQKAGTTKVLQPPTAPEKYVFTGWTADVGTVTGATYTFVAADATVTAVFELDSRVIDNLIGQAEDILAEGDEVYEEDYLEELEDKLNELKDAVENGADDETVKTLLDELEALINEAENNKHVWGPWEILEPADYGVTGTEIRYCQHDGCTHFQTRSYEISEARDREIQFTHTKGTYFIAHLGNTDYYAYVDGKVIKWYSGATVNFDVVVTPEFRYEKYVVFMNGNVIEPNEDGSFTIPAGCDRAVITVVGAYEGGSESGSGAEHSSGSGVCKLCGQDHGNTIWGRLVAFIHMIIYFFKNLFR
ncbi:MAG: InlB B-repeat-containing protein [Clostridia bacterium]|nr:InlB B-repeat-containing protein [Clostridia bacterium]